MEREIRLVRRGKDENTALHSLPAAVVPLVQPTLRLTGLWIIVVSVVEQDSVEGHCAWFRPGQTQGS